MKSTTVIYICRNNIDTVLHYTGKLIGDVHVFVAETVPMREALKAAMQAKVDNLIIESDSQLLINVVLGKIKVPGKIANLLNSILILGKSFRNA